MTQANAGMHLLNLLFFVFHSGLVVFNLTGWYWRRTRRWHLLTMGATLFSWFVMGAWRGWGYCLCTDWHFQIRRSLGMHDGTTAYIQLQIRALTGILISRSTSDILTVLGLLLALVATIIVWIPRRRSMVTGSVIVLLLAGAVAADEDPVRHPGDFQSEHFLIHTDLTEDEAEELLGRLETMLKIISRYWGAPAKKTIECFVVRDLQNWPNGLLHPESIPHIRQGGITVASGMRLGRQFDMKAVVYASAEYGTPQHEAVHAYCYQTFGTTGPTWYAEGMAEMGNYWIEGNPTVTCPEYIIQYLQSAVRPDLETITARDQQTGDGWRAYSWRWALCHFLANNPNYSDRFRQLGASLLNGRGASFERAFEVQRDELEFEFTFFLDHLQPGFDAGRCAWDWKTRPREPRGPRPVRSSIRADRGWQASGVRVAAGSRYALDCEGTWSTSEDSVEHGPDGSLAGHGRLLGCILSGRTLSDPFPVDVSEPLTTDFEGHLYLRCEDAWNSLADNSGTLKITVSEFTESDHLPIQK